MEIEIRNEPLNFDLYGIGGDVIDHDYAGTGKRLMDEMWAAIRSGQINYIGINFWVYDSVTRMFVGVELNRGEAHHGSLEYKPVSLAKYVYYKHIGPYEKLGDVHRGLEEEMKKQGLEEIGPRVEKYGHWTEDQSKLITEVYVAIK